LGDNPFRPDSTEFGNHTQVRTTKRSDATYIDPDNWV